MGEIGWGASPHAHAGLIGRARVTDILTAWCWERSSTRASAPWANHAIYSLAETDLLQPLRVWKPHRVAILLFIIDIISEEKDWESGKKACH